MNYETLIDNWKKSMDEWRNFEDNAAIVAAKVYSILKKKLELKDESLFRLVDPDEKDNDKLQKTMYSHVGATKLTDNGWAKFGLILTLQMGENTWPKRSLRFVSFVKVTNQNVLFKVTEDADIASVKFEFDTEDEEVIENQFDQVIQHVINDSFKNWLNS